MKTQDEFVPHDGTRKEFMQEFKGMFENWLPHHQLARIIFQSYKKQEEMLRTLGAVHSSKVFISVCDYASQINVNREFNATCSHEAKINCCVLVMGHHFAKKEAYIKGKNPDEDHKEMVDTQQTDAFYGLFGSDHKPSAHHYNLFREDAEHFLKFGSLLHGEGFVDGMRIPMKEIGHEHEFELPEAPNVDRDGNRVDIESRYSLEDMSFDISYENASCAEVVHHIERNDGCGCQYQGKTNAGLVGRSLHGPTSLRRYSCIGAPMHGKAIADALGFLVKEYLSSAIPKGRALGPGARNAVLYLAQFHPTLTWENVKSGPWSPKRLIYIHYSDKHWSKAPLDFKNSMPKKFHFRASLPHYTSEHMQSEWGQIIARLFPCPCPSCVVPLCDYDNCKLKKLLNEGIYKPVGFKFIKVMNTAQSQTRQATLKNFTTSIKLGQVCAVQAGEAPEDEAEGDYWLIKVEQQPYRVASAFTDPNGQQFNRGAIVVQARYFQFQRTTRDSKREYILLDDVHNFDSEMLVRTSNEIVLSQAPRNSNRYYLSNEDDLMLTGSPEPVRD